MVVFIAAMSTFPDGDPELFPMTLELALDANVGASSSRFVFNCSSGADGAQSVSTIVIHLYLETAS